MASGQQSLNPGQRLNQFEVRAVLGQGGFGITYQGWDTELQRKVAIKEFLPADLALRDSASETVVPRENRESEYQYGLQRFLEEARTLARFSHPNIIRVHAFFQANGSAYLVMEYEEGESLSSRLKRQGGTLCEDDIRQIFVPILKGLAEIHQAGFLHRDIKPGNIYLRENGEPVLIDFGAARQAIGEHSRSVTGIVSAGYAPPEQYTTDSKKQGPWSDIYALGATLYRCISGSDPVDSPTRRESLHEEEADPLVSACDVGAGKYTPELLRLIDECLILSYKRRPAEAKAVLARLQAFKPGIETSTHQSGPRSTLVTEFIASKQRGFGKTAEIENVHSSAGRIQRNRSTSATACLEPSERGSASMPSGIKEPVVSARDNLRSDRSGVKPVVAQVSREAEDDSENLDESWLRCLARGEYGLSKTVWQYGWLYSALLVIAWVAFLIFLEPNTSGGFSLLFLFGSLHSVYMVAVLMGAYRADDSSNLEGGGAFFTGLSTAAFPLFMMFIIAIEVLFPLVSMVALLDDS